MVGLEAGFEIENEFYDKEKIEQEEHMVDIKIKEFQMKTGENNEEPYYIISLLKWIQNEIHIQEVEMKTNFDKVNLKIESEEDVTHVISLFRELKLILSEDSNDPDIKQDLLRKERFTEEEAHWPNRWFLHIHCSWNPISPKVWQLPQVELFQLKKYFKGSTLKCHKDVPYGIGRLKHLKILDIENNHIKHLPYTIIFCQKLEQVKLEHNEFRYLPGFLLNLPNWKLLSRESNYLQHHLKPAIFVWPVTKVTNDEFENFESEKEKTLLYKAAVELCLNLVNIESIYSLNLPKSLLPIIEDLLEEKLSFCDHCQRFSVHKTGCYYSFVMTSYMGYKNLPFRGFCCSRRDCFNRMIDIKIAKHDFLRMLDYTLHILPYNPATAMDLNQAVNHPSACFHIPRRKRFGCFPRWK